MQPSEAYHYITRSKKRTRVLCHMDQPLTARQIAGKVGLSFDACRETVRDLALAGLVRCLNESARRSRLYWLTGGGMACQRQVCQFLGRAVPGHFYPAVDWNLFGWTCYSHRATIIKTLSQPLQPADIKRKARARQSSLRMSANNVRDVMRLFLAHGIVRAIQRKKRAHRMYELSETGLQFQELLRRAEVPA